MRDQIEFVDDAAHTIYMEKAADAKNKAFDLINYDAVYGDDMNDEERLEKMGYDDSLGFGFGSLRRGIGKLGRGVGRGIKRGVRGVGRGIRKVGSLAKKFVPSRDKKKAEVVRRLNKKLVVEHANFLARQAKSSGQAVQPMSYYRQQSKSWAKQKIAAGKLPTSYVVSGADVLGADLLGADVMGAWWNPLTWFTQQASIVINNTAGERSATGPEEDPSTDPSAAPSVDPSMDPMAVEPGAEEYQEAYPDQAEGDPMSNVLSGISGEDSFASVAGDILGRNTDDSGLDPWLHKLNPTYWLRSKQARDLKDKEVRAWKENADLQKLLKKQQEDLSAAERAAAAQAAVKAAQEQSAATSKQVQEIAAKVSGMGHEKPTEISDVLREALRKDGHLEVAQALVKKIRAGETLDPDEVKVARDLARRVGKMKVVHGDLMGTAYVESCGDFVGSVMRACTAGDMTSSQKRCDKHTRLSDAFARRLATGQPLSGDEVKVLGDLLRDQDRLRSKVKATVRGDYLAGHPDREKIAGQFLVGAAKAMSSTEKKQLAEIVRRAKQGNPYARKALTELRKSGEIMGGDYVGFSISSAFKAATSPIWYPAKKLAQAAKWVGKKTGIVSSSPSAQQARLNRLKAALARKNAAAAKAAAADAETQAEQRVQAAIAEAAAAEADAADAAAARDEEKSRTAEVEANPDAAATDAEADASDDSMGAAGKAAGKAAKTKVRAGAALYVRAKRGDKKAVAAIRTMVAKAKAGDPQAQRDVNAVKAGRMAYAVSLKKSKTEKRLARREKVAKFQRNLENRAGDQLARMSRRRQLRVLASVERKANTGNKKARKYVIAQVTMAKKGDPKAKARVQAMVLAKKVRLHSRTRADRKGLVEGQKLAARVRRGDPKAIRQYEIIRAAAAKGNPNAKRAMERIALGGAVLATVTTGVVVARKSKKKGSKKDNQRKVEVAVSKMRAGTGTREELAAGAKAAHAEGDQKTAGELAKAAASAPSATEQLKRTAAVVAASEAGQKDAQSAIDKNLEAAKRGDPGAIKNIGDVMAVKTISAVEKGEPVSPTVQDATNLHERALHGDRAAIAAEKEIAEKAAVPNPTSEAVLAAGAVAGAAVAAKAMAAKPAAREEYLQRVNQLSPEEKTGAEAELTSIQARVEAGTATPEEGARGVSLATKLGKGRIAAEISAKAPPMEDDPMSSLPDVRLTPIQGIGELAIETARALTLSTRDPFGNYREGVASMGRGPADTSMGWSALSIFRKALNLTPAGKAVSMVESMIPKGGGKKEAPAPAETTAKAPSAAPAEAATQASGMGSERDAQSILRDAIQAKKISRADFNRAVEMTTGKTAPDFVKKTVGEDLLRNLRSKGVTVS